MGKLSLAIVDMDENYLKRLGNYLIVHYSGRFNIHLFSSPEKLGAFLNSNTKRPDILLYSQSFPKEVLLPGKVHTMIRLSENSTYDRIEDADTIPKYRHAERFVQDILHIYSRSNPNVFMPDRKTGAKINTVHSSSGGAGKTSVAAGLSMLAARRNIKTLYLNFECTPSTAFYFKGSSERTFSDIIYYLKEKGNNLAVKLEGGCCSDPASGVHYFLPPESAFEFEELADEDIDLFLGTIRSLSLFDIVFIDLPSGLSRRNNFILKASDKIINVCTLGAFSRYRDGVMERDPAVTDADGKNDFSSRIFHILNKYTENMNCDLCENDYLDRFSVIISESEKLKYSLREKLLIDLDPTFSASLGKLFDCLVAGYGKSCKPGGGVEYA